MTPAELAALEEGAAAAGPAAEQEEAQPLKPPASSPAPASASQPEPPRRVVSATLALLLSLAFLGYALHSRCLPAAPRADVTLRRFRYSYCPGPLLEPAWKDNPWGLGWLPYHQQLAAEVARADQGEGFELVFYGDSITEDWRGTAVGLPWPLGAGTPAVFEAYFARPYRAEVLAISGDQVGHLWWRLLHGELPTRRPPRVAVLAIGTNDLAMADCFREEAALAAAVPGIVARIGEVARLVRRGSGDATQVVLQGVLPRGAPVYGARLLSPVPVPAPTQFAYPNRLTPHVAAINAGLQALAEATESVSYIDCGGGLVSASEGMIDPALLPDGLHPNHFGMELIAQCLRPLIDSLMAQNATAPGL